MITFNTSSGLPVDPATAEIIRYELAGAADEMRLALVRSAFSPIVYEGQDFAGALYDTKLRLLAQCSTLPLFQGTLDVCIAAALAHLGGPAALRPGDLYLLNYPWDTGSHANDMAVVAPGFVNGHHVGFAVVKAHHMDLGGTFAGVTTASSDVWQEGCLYPAVRIFAAGARNEDLYRTLLMNTRIPTAFAGDLAAQCGAARLGLAGLERILRRHGQQTFEKAAQALFQHAETHMRTLLHALPDGRWTAQGAHDGGSAGLTGPARYSVTVEIAGDELCVDLTEAAAQVRGPVNSPRASVVSAVRAAIMAFAGAGEIANDGHFRPIRVLTRPGTIFDPLPGAPVGLYAFPLLAMMDVLFAALAQVVPGRIPAAGNSVAGFALWGVREAGDFWGGATHFCGGQGASALYGDGGAPVMHIAASGIRHSSFEAWEAALPVIVLQAEYAQDSGGAGRYQGAPGITIQMRALREMDLTAIFERTQTAPFGLAGGEAARPNRLRLCYPDGSSESVSRCNRRIPADTLILIEMSGGGGYGLPQERRIEAIQSDLRDGYVSEGWAHQHYPHAL